MTSTARILRQQHLWSIAFLGMVLWSSFSQVRLYVDFNSGSYTTTSITKAMEQVVIPVSTHLDPMDEVDNTTSTSTTAIIQSLGQRNDAMSSSSSPPRKTIKTMMEDASAAVSGADVCEASIDYAAIAQRRHIQHPGAVQLLQRIVQHDKQLLYNNATDLLVFDHVLKTSGTSFSKKLGEIFQPNATVPGSRMSNFFQHKELTEAMPGSTEHGTRELRDFWQHQKVLYSHSSLLQTNGKTDFQDWLLHQIPNRMDSNESVKRVLVLTLVRDPLDWLASNYYEWMCTLGRRILETHRGLYPLKKPPTKHPNKDPSCWGMANLTLLADYWHQHTLPRLCKEEGTQKCQTREETAKTRCRSINHLIQSDIFRNHMQHYPEYLTLANASESLVELEERSFRVYGGIQPHSRIPVGWIGLTERYDESLVLFYDWLRLPMENVTSSLRSDPKERFKSCRPLSFWTNDDIAKVKKLVARSYVVHNVANSILDARMAVWCCHRRTDQDDRLTQWFCK